MQTRFQTLDLAMDAAAQTILLAKRVRGVGKSIADQAIRAAGSCPLNIAEGAARAGRDRQYHYRVALGSADEAKTALELLRRIGEVPEQPAHQALALWGSVARMLTKLARG